MADQVPRLDRAVLWRCRYGGPDAFPALLLVDQTGTTVDGQRARPLLAARSDISRRHDFPHLDALRPSRPGRDRTRSEG